MYTRYKYETYKHNCNETDTLNPTIIIFLGLLFDIIVLNNEFWFAMLVSK
jgi:hypothetical protein